MIVIIVYRSWISLYNIIIIIITVVMPNVLSDANTRCRGIVTVVSCVIFSFFPSSVPCKLVWIEPDHTSRWEFKACGSCWSRPGNRFPSRSWRTKYWASVSFFFATESLRLPVVLWRVTSRSFVSRPRRTDNFFLTVGSVSSFPSKRNDSDL